MTSVLTNGTQNAIRSLDGQVPGGHQVPGGQVPAVEKQLPRRESAWVRPQRTSETHNITSGKGPEEEGTARAKMPKQEEVWCRTEGLGTDAVYRTTIGKQIVRHL